MMKRLVILAWIGGLAFDAAVYASANGTELIGLSPASQALGGSGVANYTNGTDAIYKNPSLLSESGAPAGKVVGEFFGTYCNVNASASNGVVSADSQSKARFAPEIVATYKADDKLAFGIGILGFGGGVGDYTGQTAANSGGTSAVSAAVLSFDQLKTSFNLMRVAPAVSYRATEWLSLGISPFATYGEFALNEDVATPGVQSTRNKHGKFGVGVELGATAKAADGLLLGATVTSKSSQTYDALLDLDQLGPTPLTTGTTSGLNAVQVTQPLEIAAGGTYKLTQDLTITADYRFINWSKAAGYLDFGWRDQHVFGGGVQYQMDKVVLRAGYQYARSPVEDVSGEAGGSTFNIQGHSVYAMSLTKLNLVAFPAIAEHHITLGAGYKLCDDLNLDVAFLYSPKKTVSRQGSFLAAGETVPYTFTATTTQWSVSAGAAYRF